MRPFARPMLALSLLLIASLACSITVSEVRLDGARLFADAEGSQGTRAFDRDQTFYTRATLRKAPDGATIRLVWQAVNVGAEQAAFTIASEEIDAQEGPLAFEVAPPAEGWQPGDYAAEYYVNGKLKLTLPFTVRGRR